MRHRNENKQVCNASSYVFTYDRKGSVSGLFKILKPKQSISKTCMSSDCDRKL